MNTLHYELVVVGGGASGTAAAIAATRLGVKTLLLEKESEIGGTAVWAGVNVWEMSVSGSGLCLDIYRELSRMQSAVGIYSFGHHACWPSDAAPPYPGAQLIIDPSIDYSQTLRRYGSKGILDDEAFVREHWHGVVFEPYKYVEVLHSLLYNTGSCEVWTEAEIVDISHGARVAENAVVLHKGECKRISADYWIDSTADAVLCSMLGCRMMNGVECKQVFGEIDAPELPFEETNGVSLIFRVSKDTTSAIPPPALARKGFWWTDRPVSASIAQYPNGDWNVNMLPTMEGKHYRDMSPEEAYAECSNRVWAYWEYLQSVWPDFAQHNIIWIAPRIGVREGPRTVCQYVLTENDILAGLDNQPHADIIAIADHAVDIHNSSRPSPCSELSKPYGIPLRCLLPEGLDNVLVACRGAGFSHIAAASCRLTRTMIAIGQAAGTSVALAKDYKTIPQYLEPNLIQSALQKQNVTLRLPVSKP